MKNKCVFRKEKNALIHEIRYFMTVLEELVTIHSRFDGTTNKAEL